MTYSFTQFAPGNRSAAPPAKVKTMRLVNFRRTRREAPELPPDKNSLNNKRQFYFYRRKIETSRATVDSSPVCCDLSLTEVGLTFFQFRYDFFFL